nr:SpoIIE family protein phosphatase [uncultured Rhodoferax sp.]
MRWLLLPTIWLSARLSFSRKYALIGILVLIALSLLSWPLLRQVRAEIQLAQLERSGLDGVGKQWSGLAALVALRTDLILSGGATGPELQSHRQALDITALQSQAHAIGQSPLQQRLQQAWLQVQQLDDGADTQRSFAVLTGTVNAVMALMRESARHYRLNVDAELDATFDLLSQRLPQAYDTLGKQHDALRIHNDEMSSYALGAQVVLSEAVPAVKAGVMQLPPDPAAAAGLEQLVSSLVAGIGEQQDAAELALSGTDGAEALHSVMQRNQQVARQLFSQVLARADTTLEQRIVRLQGVQAVVFAILAGMMLVLAYLFAGIYLSTQRTLRTLAHGTRDFCSGKLDTRIVLESRDELVLVADNFNTIAAEFSRLLDVIHEQNESRQRELETLVRARTQELAEKNEQLQTVNVRVQEEINLARNVQLAILPQSFPQEASWSVYACMHPARELGGDFYDCFALPKGRYGILVADVSGKGVGAAFFMAVSRTVLLNLALTNGSPSEVLAQANELLCERNPMELFVTVCYGVYDPLDGSLVYASAGHHAPVVRKADGRVLELPTANDVALAVMPGMAYQDQWTRLDAGDRLLLYTDGVTEAFSPEGEEYGQQRLRQWFAHATPQHHARALIEDLVRDVHAFVRDAPASDDLTCLIVCRQQGETSMQQTPVLQNKVLLLDTSIASRLECIAELAAQVDGVLPQRPDLAFTANLCLEELITNTIQHGLSGMPDRRIHVRISMSEEWLEIILKDDAPPFDPFAEAPLPDTGLDVEQRPIGGLGVHLVKTMMDEARAYYDGSGNLIVLLKALAQPNPEGK